MSENIHERPLPCSMETLEATTLLSLEFARRCLELWPNPKDMPDGIIEMLGYFSEEIAKARAGYHELLRLEHEHERTKTSRPAS